MNIHQILQQAQKLQEQLVRIQDELGEKTVTASSGGGLVQVVANGRQEILSITIDLKEFDPPDVSMIQDLIVAAVNEALRKSRQLLQDEMAKITGGIRIPGLTA